ncbi:MAG: phenylalanine 4-monooxygenase, partial [Caulobacteraceae bacterium]|nr:phenylalanine 4-monooxygenase [Caulobacteraceae bacterium]
MSVATAARVAPSPDWVIDQGWANYGAAEHQVWVTLYERQKDILPGRACDAYLRGLEALDLHRGGIPDFARINPELQRLTGWNVVAVPGLVPDEVFFEHLANRRFPAGQFIRKPDQLDYLSEPDIFHDVFGHVPMLTDPVFADYMQAYGEGGLRAGKLEHLHHLARLYWYTVEFGLMETQAGLRIYGAGIV